MYCNNLIATSIRKPARAHDARIASQGVTQQTSPASSMVSSEEEPMTSVKERGGD